jgi:hypothetical protein
LYADDTVPPGRLFVVIVSIGAIMILSACVVVLALKSLTFTVKLDVPAVVGVPEITPAELIASPVGKAPAESDHVYGVVPFATCSVWL